MKYPDTISITRKGAPTGARNEFGKQTETASSSIYSGRGEIQDFPQMIQVEIAGNEDLKGLARLFLRESFDVLTSEVGDAVSGTYKSTGRTRTGTVKEIEPFTTSIVVKWEA